VKNKKIPVRTVLRSKNTNLRYRGTNSFWKHNFNSDYLFGILKLFFLKILMDYFEDYARQ
jgi:hypothetical protein